MQRQRLGTIEAFFSSFSRAYVTGGAVSEDVRQKLGHSRRVAALCARFAEELGWAESDLTAVRAMGLVHDVGRFIQFSVYGTFDDAASVDHGEIGAQLLEREQVFSCDPPSESGAILFAVRHHNQRHPPECGDTRPMAYLKLLRDADKIDIMETFGKTIRNGDMVRFPQMFANRDAEGPVDDVLLADIQNGKVGSYGRIGSLKDIVLVGASWIHDINTIPALRYVCAQGLLDGFEAVLSGSDAALAVLSDLRQAVSRRLRNSRSGCGAQG